VLRKESVSVSSRTTNKKSEKENEFHHKDDTSQIVQVMETLIENGMASSMGEVSLGILQANAATEIERAQFQVPVDTGVVN